VIQVSLPHHLRTLAKESGEVGLSLPEPVTLGAVLDALEARYPMLRGTMRDHATRHRRPFIRFYAAGEDWSNQSPDLPLPPAVRTGAEPLLVVGAMSGG
jgi:molybdopterin synthase sulfur carrier subunit